MSKFRKERSSGDGERGGRKDRNRDDDKKKDGYKAKRSFTRNKSIRLKDSGSSRGRSSEGHDRPYNRDSRKPRPSGSGSREERSGERKPFSRDDAGERKERRSFNDERGSERRKFGSSEDRGEKKERRPFKDEKRERRSFKDEDTDKRQKRAFGGDREERRENRSAEEPRGERRERRLSDDEGDRKKRKVFRDEHDDKRGKRTDRDERKGRTHFNSDRGKEGAASRSDERKERSERSSADEKPRERRSFGDEGRDRRTNNSRREFGADKRSGSRDSDERRERSSYSGGERDSTRRVKYDELETGKGFSKPSREKKAKTPPPKEGSADGLTRLNKYLSNAGIASRREADTLIQSGAVKVNGVVVDQLGYKIKPGDKVTYGDEAVKGERKIYLLLNKPKDYITTVDDPQERRTVMDLIKGACKERIYPVGRLDRKTTGLLLLTNDGELTTKLTHPKFGVKKVYHVSLNKGLRPDDFKKIVEGVELEDGVIKADDLAFVGEGKKEIGIEIHSGRNRVVRRLFEHLGYDVLKLDRVVFAGLTKKDLPRGKHRFLSAKEVSFLKMIG